MYVHYNRVKVFTNFIYRLKEKNLKYSVPALNSKRGNRLY